MTSVLVWHCGARLRTTDSETQANWVAFDANLQDLNVDVVLVLQWKCVYYATERLWKRDAEACNAEALEKFAEAFDWYAERGVEFER